MNTHAVCVQAIHKLILMPTEWLITVQTLNVLCNYSNVISNARTADADFFKIANNSRKKLYNTINVKLWK